MKVCQSCGALALARSRQCGVCEMPLAVGTAGQIPAGLVAVGLRCRFQCRGCGHLAPLDRLDLDGTVRCLRCGLDQAFDITVWNEGLAFAHAVGDLAGPEPEGRSQDPHYAIATINPYRHVGLTEICETFTASGEVTRGAQTLQRSLELRAHPGHPRCGCGGGLNLERASEGITSVCARCGRRQQHRLEPRTHKRSRTLVAVIEAQDEAPMATRGLTGSLGYSCPSCGAPLPVRLGDALVTCDHCKLVSRVAPVAGALGEDRPPRVWWAIFDGPSERRRRLLSGKDSGERRSEDEDEADEVEDVALSPGLGGLPELPDLPRTGWRAWVSKGAMWGIPMLALMISGVTLLVMMALARR